MAKADDILVNYCKVYSMWLESLHPPHSKGAAFPTIKQRDEWHRALKEMYSYSNVAYPKYLAPELKALD